MDQSIPSANIPPPDQTPGKFLEAAKSPAQGQNSSGKVRPPGQENTYPGECFRRSVQPFLLNDVEISEFFRNHTLKKLLR